MHIYLAYARYTATSSNSFHEDRSSSRTISVPYVIQIFINIRLKWCVTRGTWTNRRHELLNVIIETKNDRTFRLTFESLSLSVSLSLSLYLNESTSNLRKNRVSRFNDRLCVVSRGCKKKKKRRNHYDKATNKISTVEVKNKFTSINYSNNLLFKASNNRS